MISREIQIQIPNGMDASPVAFLVQTANKFRSNIYLETGSKTVNAKSIMGMMTLVLSAGDKVVVAADGKDETAAVEGIESYLSGK